MAAPQDNTIRNNWTRAEALALFNQPFNDLLFDAQVMHRRHFNPNQVQLSTLLSIKTGACPEDCKYCPQSARYDTGLEKEKLLEIETVIEAAKAAKASGSSRFCMGAAWRSPHDRDIPKVAHMIREVKALGLETCMTLGMLSEEQSDKLAAAGLDYYNHNLDTSKEFYGEVITTRTYQDRLNTLSNVRNSGMKVCAGGIVGMGEEQKDRAGLLMELANLPHHPESVPINMLVKVAGTPMANEEDLDPFEFIRTIAVARLMMPKSYVRLSAGREEMNERCRRWPLWPVLTRSSIVRNCSPPQIQKLTQICSYSNAWALHLRPMRWTKVATSRKLSYIKLFWTLRLTRSFIAPVS